MSTYNPMGGLTDETVEKIRKLTHDLLPGGTPQQHDALVCVLGGWSDLVLSQTSPQILAVIIGTLKEHGGGAA